MAHMVQRLQKPAFSEPRKFSAIQRPTHQYRQSSQSANPAGGLASRPGSFQNLLSLAPGLPSGALKTYAL